MGERARCAAEEKLLALRQMRQAAWTKSLSCDSSAGTRASCNLPVLQPALKQPRMGMVLSKSCFSGPRGKQQRNGIQKHSTRTEKGHAKNVVPTNPELHLRPLPTHLPAHQKDSVALFEVQTKRCRCVCAVETCAGIEDRISTRTGAPNTS